MNCLYCSSAYELAEKTFNPSQIRGICPQCEKAVDTLMCVCVSLQEGSLRGSASADYWLEKILTLTELPDGVVCTYCDIRPLVKRRDAKTCGAPACTKARLKETNRRNAHKYAKVHPHERY